MGTSDQQADVGRRGNIRCVERRVAAADLDAVNGCAVGRNLHAAGDHAFGAVRAMSIHAKIGAIDGHGLVDIHVLVVGPGRDQERVAGRSGVDRSLDGGVAAVADQQEVVAGAVRDPLDAGEQVGPLRARAHLPAGLVAGSGRIRINNGCDVRRSERAGVDRRVGPSSTDKNVVARTALK
jgi:hypothetical protein